MRDDRPRFGALMLMPDSKIRSFVGDLANLDLLRYRRSCRCTDTFSTVSSISLLIQPQHQYWSIQHAYGRLERPLPAQIPRERVQAPARLSIKIDV